MSTWLVLLSHRWTPETISDLPIEVEAESEQTALSASENLCRSTHHGFFPVSAKRKRGGHRPGAGGKGGSPAKYGTKTKVVRVPEKIADLIPQLISSAESIQRLVDLYDNKVKESKNRTATGQPAERYKHLDEFLSQLEPNIETFRRINSLLR